MRRYLILVFIFALTMTAGAGLASAQEYNHRITVYAAVPQMRAVYIDQNGNLAKVAGNTTNNIAPQVFDLENHLIAMTSSYQSQYDRFLKAHNNYLEAGKTYIIKPPAPASDLKPVKAIDGKGQTHHQAGDNHRYIGPELKMALVY